MLIRHRFQVGPIAAPQMISSRAEYREKNIDRYAEKSDEERSYPEIEQDRHQSGCHP